MATHSSFLALRIPWAEEPGGLQSMGSKELDTTEQLTQIADKRQKGTSGRGSLLTLACFLVWVPYSQSVCGNVEKAGKYILYFTTRELRLFNGYWVFDSWRSNSMFNQVSMVEHLECFLFAFWFVCCLYKQYYRKHSCS